MSRQFPRDLMRESVMYALSRNGKTIRDIQKSGAKEGDESQKAFADKPWWHTRSELIASVAGMLKIDKKLYGKNKTSTKFETTIDREITRLRKNKVIADWNASRHLGLFRLTTIPNPPPPKPQISLAGEIPTHERQPPALDFSSENLKSKFLSIISKSAKANTYKFTLAKSLLDYCRETAPRDKAYEIPYGYFASKFLKYYWYQEYKFRMKQDFRTNGKPKVISVINEVFGKNSPGDFDLLDKQKIKEAEEGIMKNVFGSVASKSTIVIPAFQQIPAGQGSDEIKIFFDYDNDKKVLYLRHEAFEFFRRNNAILSKVVLAEWAKFLEKTNLGLPRLVAKIEQEYVERIPLLPEYWKIYSRHFDCCFYCGDRLEYGHTNVDHFIPWSYIFDNNAWNLVLACRDCNCKKSDSLPGEEFLETLIRRNREFSPVISELKKSLEQLNSGGGWRREVKNHYASCISYGFSKIRLP